MSQNFDKHEQNEMIMVDFWPEMAVLTTDIRQISNIFFDKNNNFVHNRRHFGG